MLWIKDCRHFQNWNKSGSCTLIWKAHNLNMIILLLWMSYWPSYSLQQILVYFSKLITTTIVYFAFCDVRYAVNWTSVDFHEEHHIFTVNLYHIRLFSPYYLAAVWFDLISCGICGVYSEYGCTCDCHVDSLVCISWPAGSSLQMLCRKSWWLHVDSMAGHTLAATMWVPKYYSSTYVCWLNCRSLYIYTHTYNKVVPPHLKEA